MHEAKVTSKIFMLPYIILKVHALLLTIVVKSVQLVAR
jgi:hypothetical protein